MKKQKNVQEQIKDTRESIKATAEFWRNNGLPDYVKSIFEQKNIKFNTSILLEYDRFYPGMSSDFGILLTENQEFFKFEIDKDGDKIELISFENVTQEAQSKIEDKVKGIGKSFGLIAIEVLAEMNK